MTRTLDPAALLLRSSLSRGQAHLFSEPKGKGRVEIDSGVLRALLRTTRYRHGARSMESILAMSLLSGQRQFERSSLRPQVQLDLHVCAQNFMELVHRPDPWEERLEELRRNVPRLILCSTF